MTDSGGPAKGIALRCDGEGSVRGIPHDSLGLVLTEGTAFTDFLDCASREKGRSFLAALRMNRVAFGWELNVACKDRIQSLYFSGGVVGDELLVVAAATGADSERLYDDLMRINNEQINALRNILKEQSLQNHWQEPDDEMYNGIARINNEMATLHRELAKKNVEMERLIDELQRSNDALHRLEQLRDDLTGMIVHDMRSPLGTLSNALYLVLEGNQSVLADRDRKTLVIARDNVEVLLRMSRNLLDVSRMENHALPLKRTRFRVMEATDAARKMLHSLSERKRIEIRSLAPEDPEVEADRDLFERVMVNLLGNAIKHTAAGGSIRVTASDAADRIRIEVADDGPGIPEAFRETIFEKFGRVDAPQDLQMHSFGLGLTFCRLAVEAHGGEIGVESEEGTGSVFWFTLPKPSSE